MKFPKWKLLRMVPKLATGNPKAIINFVLLLLTYSVSRSENTWDDDWLAKVMSVLDPDGDGQV